MASLTKTNPVTAQPTPERPPPTPPSAAASLGRMMLDSAERFDGTALEYRRGEHPIAISYPELGAIAIEIARGLVALGIERGDRVAILGTTSADWTLADYGALCAGAVVTPIYHTNSPEECAYVLRHSETRLVFCDSPGQAEKIARVRAECPALEHVVLFDGVREDAITLEQLRELRERATARSVQLRLQSVGPDDLATLVYTSGTTGPPKGCMLSHRNLLEASRSYVQELGIDETHTLYQFLPLAHVLARVAQAVVIRAGARACFWSGDPTRIVDELSDLHPTHFPAVPRIFEKIHGAVVGRAQDGPAPTRLVFRWALGSGARARAALRDGRGLGFASAIQYRVADRLVLSKVRNVFGPAHQLALVGAAPVARELLEFFDACGVLVLEGYGLTESCAAATLNTPAAVRFGSVGRALPRTEVTIAADGEILIRGPHVFQGYYKDLAATEAVITWDGWLRSGDLGSISDDGFVAITGRKKDLIITSSGKNISPVNVETLLRDSRYITEAVVFGDNQPYLVAMLTLDRDESMKLAEQLSVATDAASIAGSQAVRSEIQREVSAVNAKLARIEQVKRFAILDHDLTQAGGELTPTLKVKRSVVYDKYADVFAGLYGEGEHS
jgi:long-chain acyl-CoA synthetase